MNKELDRRAAFWDFFRREFLDASIRELDNRRADKWLDEEDMKCFNWIRGYLSKALLEAMNRYHSVLGEQIKSMKQEGV